MPGLRRHRYRFSEWLHTVTEGAIQRLGDRARCLDDHYPSRKQDRSLDHVRRWLDPHQTITQPETPKIIQPIKGVSRWLELTEPSEPEDMTHHALKIS